MIDLIIRNARVVDGSGAASYNADVAVENGVIAQIGSLTNIESKETIRASSISTPIRIPRLCWIPEPNRTYNKVSLPKS